VHGNLDLHSIPCKAVLRSSSSQVQVHHKVNIKQGSYWIDRLTTLSASTMNFTKYSY